MKIFRKPQTKVTLTIARSLLVVFALTSLLLAAVDGPMKQMARPGWDTFFRFASFVLFVCAMYGVMRLGKVREDRQVDLSPGSPLVTRFPDTSRNLSESLVVTQETGGYGIDDLELLGDMLMRPDLYMQRAVLDAEIQHQKLKVAASLDIYVPHRYRTNDKSVLVPMAWARKGALFQDLEVRDRSGHAISVLSRWETKALISLIVQQLFRLAYCGGRPPTTAEQKARCDAARDCVWMDDADSHGEVHSTLGAAKVEAIQAGTLDNIMHQNLIRLCSLFDAYYVLLTQVKANSHAIVRYGKTTPLYTELGGIQENPVKYYTRLILGARPHRIVAPIDLPFMVNSYHFRLTGEPGLYVKSHYLMDMDRNEVIANRHFESRPNPKPSVRLEQPSGLPYAHLYVRNFSFVNDRSLATVITFNEVPPGTLGMASAVSAVTSALLAGFTIVREYHQELTEIKSFPPFLLAFLALLASWLGFSSDREVLLRSSLLGRLGLIATTVLSLASALLYTTGEWLNKPVFVISLAGGAWAPKVNAWWFTLTSISLILTVILCFAFGRATRSYARATRKRR
ncbi:hypothetical protein [Streptomyces chartreusis]|uniref:hypothetical protein n=1 Tax=Streptomyces chartreusis TaxID=1969 RepID=UPI0033E4D23D